MRKHKRNAYRNSQTMPNLWLTAFWYGIFLLLFKTQAFLADNEFEVTRENITCIYHDSKYTCDCNGKNQVMQLPPLNGAVNQVEIVNCKDLIIHSNTLNELEGLRKISIENIEHLVLDKYAFAYSRYASGTPIIFEFKKVILGKIDSHAFNGNIEEISFLGGRIDIINPFGFTTLKEGATIIKMDGVWFGKIEAQAFKRFEIEKLEIKNCVFESNIPSKAFYEVEVRDTFTIQNVRFREVFTKAFSFKTISKILVTNNFFDKVHAAWIEAQVLQNVIFRGNSFGEVDMIAFNAITLHRDYAESEPLELHFINNKVRFNSEPRPLEFNPQLTIDIKNLQYDNTYACKDLDNEKPPQPKSEFFRKFVDQVYFQSGTKNKYYSENHRNHNENQSYLVLAKLIESDCRQRSYLLYIILGVFSIILLLVLMAVIAYCRWSRNRRRKMDVVMPEPRTYKETQIVYQIENAGLLKTDL